MSINHLLPLLALISLACNQASNNVSQDNKEQTSTANTTVVAETQKNVEKPSAGFWEKLEMKEIRDKNGVLNATIPYPVSWHFMPANNEGISITGPNGVKVIDYPMQNFMINYNQQLERVYAGQQMREFPGVEQLIQQDVIPRAANRGLKFVRSYEIPEISKIDKWYIEQLYEAIPARNDVGVFGMEWTSTEGNPYFMLLHLRVNTNEAMQLWGYSISSFEADPAHFESAKKQWIFSQANMRYNLEPIMTYNQQEAQRVGQSWAAHNQRMAQNQANFEASQRAFVNKSNAINEAIMSGWKERNASGDKQQEQYIDGIYERTNVQDQSTGQMYKVAAGANQYWMNSNGEYISTQLHTYNPNLDENMNAQKWQELKKVKE
ncbi:MAG: hypothetical protein ABIN36_14820 [Ferruginibacter sp.]